MNKLDIRTLQVVHVASPTIHDTHHNDIQYKGTQFNAIQYKGAQLNDIQYYKKCDTRHNDIQNNVRVLLCCIVVMPNVANNPFMLSVVLNVVMLNVSNNPFMLSVVMLNIVMLTVAFKRGTTESWTVQKYLIRQTI